MKCRLAISLRVAAIDEQEREQDPPNFEIANSNTVTLNSFSDAYELIDRIMQLQSAIAQEHNTDLVTTSIQGFQTAAQMAQPTDKPEPAEQFWRSIESAPKDGSDLLLADFECCVVGSWNADRLGGVWENGDGEIVSADFWMPLPSLPCAVKLLTYPRPLKPILCTRPKHHPGHHECVKNKHYVRLWSNPQKEAVPL